MLQKLLVSTIIVCMSILFIGCHNSPKYKVGDCFKNIVSLDRGEFRERWEEKPEELVFYAKVLEVGKYKYRTRTVNLINDSTTFPLDGSIDYIDKKGEKIPCPKVLENEK